MGAWLWTDIRDTDITNGKYTILFITLPGWDHKVVVLDSSVVILTVFVVVEMANLVPEMNKKISQTANPVNSVLK